MTYLYICILGNFQLCKLADFDTCKFHQFWIKEAGAELCQAQGKLELFLA